MCPDTVKVSTVGMHATGAYYVGSLDKNFAFNTPDDVSGEPTDEYNVCVGRLEYDEHPAYVVVNLKNVVTPLVFGELKAGTYKIFNTTVFGPCAVPLETSIKTDPEFAWLLWIYQLLFDPTMTADDLYDWILQAFGILPADAQYYWVLPKVYTVGPQDFEIQDYTTGSKIKTITVTVLRLDITEIRGLYRDDGSYLAGYTSDDDRGRVYCNRTYDPSAPSNPLWNKDHQHIDLTVEIAPPGVTLPQDARIVWESSDPDDPSDDGMDLASAEEVDPYDYDGNDADNDGADRDSEDNSHDRDDHPLFEVIGPYAMLPVGETKIVGGISKVRVNLTDDGGDNFIIKARIRFAAGVASSGGDETGIMTVWKRIDVEYRRMIPSKTLPVALVQPHFDKAFVEWHFHDEGVCANHEYLEPNPGQVAYCAKWTSPSSVGQFRHRGDGGWHFVCCARKAAEDSDGDPPGRQMPSDGTGKILTQSADGIPAEMEGYLLGDLTQNWDIDEHNGKVLWINPTGPHDAFFYFLIGGSGGNVLAIAPYRYLTPHGAEIRALNLQSPELSLGSTVTYNISEGATGGYTPGVPPDANVVVYRETLEHKVATDPSLPSLQACLLRTLIHELMHSFGLHHECGNADWNGTHSCAGMMRKTPVLSAGGVTLLPAANDFCGAHLRAIREADGYGGE